MLPSLAAKVLVPAYEIRTPKHRVQFAQFSVEAAVFRGTGHLARAIIVWLIRQRPSALLGQVSSSKILPTSISLP